MPRIDPVPERHAGLLKRLAYRYARRSYGKVPDPMTLWAHSPAVFWSQSLYESAVARTWRRLPRRLADLAVLRAASVVGCPWCLDFGSLLATHAGVTPTQLGDLHRWRDSGAFDDVERLVLEYADAATATPMTVTDDLVGRLRGILDDGAVVELTALVALENQRSRFNHALGITAQGFTTDACAPATVTSWESSTADAG